MEKNDSVNTYHFLGVVNPKVFLLFSSVCTSSLLRLVLTCCLFFTFEASIVLPHTSSPQLFLMSFCEFSSLKHLYTFCHLSFPPPFLTEGCTQQKGSCLFLHFSEDEHAASFMFFWQLPKSHNTRYRNNHHFVFQPLSFTVITVLRASNRCTLALGLFICPLASCNSSALADHDWFWCDAVFYGWRCWSVS